MAHSGKRPLSQYVEAFARYSPGEGRVFHTRPFGRHALVNDGNAIYKVSHFEDLADDYAAIFQGDPGQIYTEFPGALWDEFLTVRISLTNADLVIELYRAWQLFWDRQIYRFTEQSIFDSARSDSFELFNRLTEKFYQDPDELLETAESLDDTVFLPVIALTIKSQYDQDDEFFKDCVRLMTGRFPDQVGDGQVLVKISPEDNPEREAYTFFIYSVDEDF